MIVVQKVEGLLCLDGYIFPEPICHLGRAQCMAWREREARIFKLVSVTRIEISRRQPHGPVTGLDPEPVAA